MKLLLDENVSFRLKKLLKPHFDIVTHVSDIRFAATADEQIWPLAKQEDFTIVTRDKDFLALSAQMGHPPKVIWINIENPRNQDVIDAVLAKINVIKHFMKAANGAILEVNKA